LIFQIIQPKPSLGLRPERFEKMESKFNVNSLLVSIRVFKPRKRKEASAGPTTTKMKRKTPVTPPMIDGLAFREESFLLRLIRIGIVSSLQIVFVFTL